MNWKHFSLVCKHKHVLKTGAPPERFEGCTLLPMEFYGLTTGYFPWGYQHYFEPKYYLIF